MPNTTSEATKNILQETGEIRCLIRTSRSPFHESAEQHTREKGESLRQNIWGKQSYIASQKWFTDQRHDAGVKETIKALVENHTKFREKHKEIKNKFPAITADDFETSAPHCSFAKKLGYTENGVICWEIAERDVEEVKFTYKKKPRIADMQLKECNSLKKTVGQMNYFCIASYTDRRNQSYEMILCPVRVKESFPVDEDDDKYHIPVTVRVPDAGNNRAPHYTYDGYLYAYDGICTLQISNMPMGDAFEMRFSMQGDHKDGVFIGKSLMGSTPVVGPGVFIPSDTIFDTPDSVEKHMTEACKSYKADTPPPPFIDKELWAHIVKRVNWPPRK